jgi:alkanesulfonate monooxygenase SsuD/methylene tetrahydromethanopterin reductase-like flavin-dependent oxidoreductase (luciferase family)
VKIFNFHLMPYAHADLDAIERNGTAWVTYSNKHYDAAKGADLYHEYLDQLEAADDLGFDGIAVNEHHQTAYGIMPSPGVLAGALARRIKNGVLAVLGRALPLVNNPLTVAEEFAILDNLTRGRFIAGFVRGIGAEYHSFGVNPADSAGRFAEAHDLIIRAWTEPGPFAHEGTYYNFKYVNPWPLPYQKPHMPIFIPSSGSISTLRWVAKLRYTYCQTLAPIGNVAKIFDAFREAADKCGYEASPDQLAWSNFIYVGETDEKALRDVRPHLEAYANRFLKTNPAFMSPPGYTTVESLKKQRAMRGERPAHQSAEELIERGIVIVGSASTVREKLAAYQDLAGFNYSLTKTQVGTMPHAMVQENQIAIAQEVLPYFRGRVPQKAQKIAAE